MGGSGTEVRQIPTVAPKFREIPLPKLGSCLAINMNVFHAGGFSRSPRKLPESRV